MNKKNILILVGILSILFLSFPIKAEIVIYDNITTSNFKVLKIDDIANINYINEYPYEIYLNNSYYGTFKKNENIFIPDNVDVKIIISDSIKTDFSQSYDVGKVYLTLGIMYFIGFGIIVVLIIVGIRKLWRR